MKVLSIYIFLLLGPLVLTSHAQPLEGLKLFDECTVNVRNAPVLRGLGLGLTRAEVEAVIPRSSGVNINNLTMLEDPKLLTLKGFEGIESVYVRFAPQGTIRPESVVDAFAIRYDRKAVTWQSGHEFALRMQAALGVPFKPTFVGEEYKSDCDGFIVNVRPNLISIYSTELEDARKLKAKEEEENKKKAFKP